MLKSQFTRIIGKRIWNDKLKGTVIKCNRWFDILLTSDSEIHGMNATSVLFSNVVIIFVERGNVSYTKHEKYVVDFEEVTEVI